MKEKKNMKLKTPILVLIKKTKQNKKIIDINLVYYFNFFKNLISYNAL